MFGKKFSEYIRFQRGILILIVVVFLVRLGISLSGVPIAQARWVSVNIALLVGLVYAAITVHTAGFGAYKQLFGLLLVQNVLAHVLIAIAIILGILTGSDNIYTAPEFFGGADGKNWLHVLAHSFAGFFVTLFSWLFGSLILFVTRKVR
jgi:hypothetical protein